MPKQTFFNLPEDKQRKIMDAALAEFSAEGYAGASINAVVRGSGIPKGSFYQYFEDKRDLFGYICAKAAEQKMQFIGTALAGIKDMDFFSLFREMYVQGIKFGKAHPEYYRISNELLSDAALRNEIFGEQIGKSDSFFEQYIRAAMDKGEIREDTDPEFVSRILTSVSLALGEYFLEKHGFEHIEELEKYADMFIRIIKEGIAGRKGNDDNS